MDYYSPNFNTLPFQDLGESDVPSLASISKANTHYEHTVYDNPENTVYSMISSDEHDKVLIDPAYRMQRKAESEMKAKIYVLAMEDYEKEQYLKSSWREPLSKLTYENLINAEVVIRKLDRQFRKLTKFHTRYQLINIENTWTQSTIQEEKREC